MCGESQACYHYDQTSFNGLTIANGKGQRTGMTDASGSTAWSFDITVGTGWKTTERRTLNGVTKTVVSQNNLGGGLSQLTNPSGTVILYGFDAAGRATSASGGFDQYAQSATYAPHGALQTLNNGGIFGGGVNSTYFYNNRLQPCRMHVRTSGSAPTACGDTMTAVGNVLDFKYSFDSAPGAGVVNNGNVVQLENKRDTNRTQNFTYDELNRIRTATTQATSGTHAWGLTFGYDVWANLLSATVTQGSAPQLSLGAALSNRIAGFCYDAAGNLQIEGPCGGTVTYTYDAENRITTTAGVTYTYDGDGKRVKKSNGRLYWGELAESDLAGTISEEYIFFGGKRIARRIVATGVVFYYFADHLGTSRVILQAGTSSPCFDADYYPFGGERTPVTNSCPQNYKFTGKERDGESGLDYFGARYYTSSSGRYISADWSEAPSTVPYADFSTPQSLNLYTYVGNNPLNSTDPDGHCCGGDDVLALMEKGFVKIGQKIEQVKTAINESLDRTVTALVEDEDLRNDVINAAVPMAVIFGTTVAMESVNLGSGQSRGGNVRGAVPAAAPAAEPAPTPGAPAASGTQSSIPRYDRSAQYGNPSTSVAARTIRANGEGQACGGCSQTMRSGTPTAPTANHRPTLKEHWYTAGRQMTDAARRQYARSAASMDEKARCSTCQSRDGGTEARKQY